MLLELVRSANKAGVEAALRVRAASAEELASALCAAVLVGNAEILDLLLQAGANPNVSPAGAYWGALHVAVEQEQLELIPMLIASGADVNLPDANGMTPLHHAIDIEADGAYQRGERPSAYVTRLLLAHGAQPNTCDRNGRTPLDLARDYQHEDAIAALEEAQKY
ncbi:ankyrin repeat domain-containing protein [Myxococcus hansupus]|uniref:ankyrin repeat domain-containing protein n=1 Tax=Pseudomyxococcus hansupus TaxID=1297742 RepID=UPI0009E31250|nr:ankyrin repeat domain-containing protein [Myxococcus hansupus]